MANDQGIRQGQIVLYEGTVFRVERVLGSYTTIRNINGTQCVLTDSLDYVGDDTISNLPPLHKKSRFRAGDFVYHQDLHMIGEVIESRDGKVRAEVYAADKTFKQYWWDEDSLHPSVATDLPAPSDGDWSRSRKTVIIKNTSGKKTEAPATKRLGISTAELIKSEVSELESKPQVRPLKTNAPTKPKQEDNVADDEPVRPIPRRKGDW